MGKPIRIQRAAKGKDNPYFVCRREPAQDRGLTWEARGLLWYLLSKPDDWVVKPSDLQQQCGRDRVYRILNELIEFKYIRRIEERDEKGIIRGYIYEVHEMPQFELLPPCENNDQNDSESKKPDTEKPDTANADTTEYREKQNTEKDIVPTAQPTPEIEKPKFDWKGIVKAVNVAIGIYGGEQNHIAHMLLGDSKTEPYQDYNLEVAATPDEITRFGIWFKRKYPDISIRKPSTIQSYFLQFRAESLPKPEIEIVKPTQTPEEAMTRWLPSQDSA